MYQTPDRLLIGGCSFTECPSEMLTLRSDCFMWPAFLVRMYSQIRFITNLAISGGGNTAMVQNLSYMISPASNWFPPEKSLILFNITGLERVDLMVSDDHPDINDFSRWNKTLPFGWITSGGWFGPDNIKEFRSPSIGLRTGNSKYLIDKLQKNQEYENIVRSNSLMLINFMHSLEALNHRYYFMLMDDQILLDAPDFFIKFLQDKDTHWIRFGEHQSMFSFAKHLGLLQSDGFHPSDQGHEKIADQIKQKIANHFGALNVEN